MGYRSDVRIMVSKKGYKELKKFVDEDAKKYATPDYDHNLLENLDVKIENEYEVLIGWDCIKWYSPMKDWYQDVGCIERGLTYINELGYSYHFSRIGEDYSDIEELNVEGELDEYELDYPDIIRTFNDELPTPYNSPESSDLAEDEKKGDE